MQYQHYIPLPRGIIEVSGDDSRNFLQGIITNDIKKLSEKNAIYALILTPQGKFLFDFFITEHEGKILIDCAISRVADLIKRLTMYKLRSRVEIKDRSDFYEVVALIGAEALKKSDLENRTGATIKFCKGVAFYDPRNIELGARAIIEKENNYKALEAKNFTKTDFAEYEKLRISLGIPDGVIDLQPDKSFPLHYKMDELGAIDFEKGCYVGQEVTTRTKHRGVIRKTIFKIESESAIPATGTPLTFQDKEVGETRSSVGNYGIALIEIEATEKTKEFLAGDRKVHVIS